MDENSLSSSPERARSVKHTYAGRAKRKRSSVSYKEEQPSESEEEINPDSAMSANVQKSVSSMKPPGSTSVPKKVDVHLPPPSPKRVRRGSNESSRDSPQKASKTPKATHNRASSIKSLNIDGKSVPSTNSKPLSYVGSMIAKPDSSKRPMTPDTDADDSSSIAESSRGGPRIRRTETERIQIFKDDPNCGNMEPHRIFCTRCDKWLSIGKKQTYALRPWEKHRARCDERAPRRTTKHEEEVQVEENEEGDDDDDAESTVAPSIAPSERSIRRSEPERQALLEADPHAQEIKPHEVLCSHCHKWVKLSATARFSLTNWHNHQRRCLGSLPSGRVATSQRKLQLVNDLQARVFTTRSVECGACGENIALEGEGDYDLTKWNDHKSHCTSVNPSPSSKPVSARGHARNASKNVKPPNSHHGPQRSTPPTAAALPAPTPPASRPPPSVASTDGTLVASSSGSPPNRSVAGEQKRPRHEDDDDEVDERPANRARTESYVPVDKEPPQGPWGWFLVPLKSFVRGFREGLRSS